MYMFAYACMSGLAQYAAATLVNAILCQVVGGQLSSADSAAPLYTDADASNN